MIGQYRALAEPIAVPVLVLRAIDGDSVSVGISDRIGGWDFGLDGHGLSLRLRGINCRERYDPGGPEAKARTAELLGCGAVPPRALPFPLTTTHDASLHGVDKYGGRIVADLRLADGRDLADVLVAEQWAIRWDGRSPMPVPPWPRPGDAA